MALVLFLVFILLPLAELYVIVQVGGAIGVWPTLAILLIDSIIGAALVRAQGREAWRRFNEQMRSGRVPGREIADGAMIVFGGALLLTPGFITDILGFLLLLPPTRAIMRGVMKRFASRHPAGRPAFFVFDRFDGRIPGAGRRSTTDSTDPGAGTDSGPAGARGPGPQRRPSRAYDVDGTADEIHDADRGLPREGQSGAGGGSSSD